MPPPTKRYRSFSKDRNDFTSAFLQTRNRRCALTRANRTPLLSFPQIRIYPVPLPDSPACLGRLASESGTRGFPLEQRHIGHAFGSEYESYDLRSTSIEDARLPIGAALISDALSLHASTRDSIDILDIGCGVGLYNEVLFTPRTSRVFGIDASEKRLEAAQARTEKLAMRPSQCFTALHADARVLPLDDESFDVALMLWVLHHLDAEEARSTRKFPGARQALHEARRVLKRDATLLIGTTFPSQLLPDEGGGCWYYRYFPHAARTLASRFMDIRELTELLRDVGFGISELQVIPEVQYALRSLDPSAPFDPRFRDSDSIFAFAHEELDRGLHALEQDITSGEVALHIAESVRALRSIGQGVILRAFPLD
jgi:ubiquinone/menaquinone biosynthesis C-methylase UbiE